MNNKYKVKHKVNDEIIKQMILLDEQSFFGEDIGIVQKCKEWVKANPNIYTVLMCNNKVVGYINFMPITKDCYQEIKQGKKRDFEIVGQDIVSFEKQKEVYCLFTSIVMDKKHQNGIALRTLWIEFIKKIKSFNVSICGVVMDCITQIGEKSAVNYLGAKYVCPSQTGKIYEGNLKLKED